LIDEFNYDQEKVAKFIGKSRAHISNCLRLLSLPKKIIEYLIDEKISQGHAKILVGLDNVELLADKIISKKLSVRQTEALVRITKGVKSITKKNKDSNILDIENQLMEKIGMRVYINNKKNNSGMLTFQYKGLDQMERLIQIIKNNY
jgi:ParB family chromosome partitioning protein